MPKSFELWDGLIVELLKHLESRYGIEEMEKWFFEVWNEPDLDFFFAGSQEDYFLLYEHYSQGSKKCREKSESRRNRPLPTMNGFRI